MHKLLYYPSFEIQDQNFLKFALLYIDEIRPIIPERARESLSNSMQDILRNTDLINPYPPNYDDGHLASIAAIEYLEERAVCARYDKTLQSKKQVAKNFTLYSDKYTNGFENYCLENRLGERCNEGIIVNKDIAFTYMSILADIISKETETDMITDITEYSDPVLRYRNCNNIKYMDRLGIIQREIQFYVPVDIYRIPLIEFIKLRSNSNFEKARKNYVTELNVVLDSYDNNVLQGDLNNVIECKKEMYGLLKELFYSCAAVVVGVHSFGNMCAGEEGPFNVLGNMGIIINSWDTMKQHYAEAREYVSRIEGKKQARKYLAKLKTLRAEIL